MTQDERLQRAWLALAGWRVEMVDCEGSVVLAVDEGTGLLTMAIWHHTWAVEDVPIDAPLPSLSSPANCGHWLAWVVQSTSGDVRLECVSGKRWHAFWRGEGEWSWVVTAGWHSPAGALMELAARVREDLPPAVVEWWKHEQGEAG